MKRPACLRSMESLFKLCLRTAIHTNSGLSSSDKEMTSTNKSKVIFDIQGTSILKVYLK